MDSVKDQLKIIDKNIAELRKENRILEALELLDESMNLRRAYLGEESPEYISAQMTLCQMANAGGLIYLKKGKFELALEYLKKAEMNCGNRAKLQAITFNNYACLYRKKGQPRVALSYLEQALKLEKHMEAQKDQADTHLNICAVLSQLGQHMAAMENVLMAIMLLQDDVIHQIRAHAHDVEKTTPEKISTLVVAYHNLAVEYEHLKRDDDAQRTYRRAFKLATTEFGEDHYLYKNLHKILSTTGHAPPNKTEQIRAEIENMLRRDSKPQNEGLRATRPQTAALFKKVQNREMLKPSTANQNPNPPPSINPLLPQYKPRSLGNIHSPTAKFNSQAYMNETQATRSHKMMFMKKNYGEIPKFERGHSAARIRREPTPQSQGNLTQADFHFRPSTTPLTTKPGELAEIPEVVLEPPRVAMDMLSPLNRQTLEREDSIDFNSFDDMDDIDGLASLKVRK